MSDIDLMLELMDRAFKDFESSMPNKPQFVQLSYGSGWRCIEKDIYQAMILKLARVQSSIRAALLLLQNGFVQEQAAIQRMIDETNEDISFLVYAITNDEITELHERFLEAFWMEEVDESGEMISSAHKRPMIPRQKIQAYLSRIKGIDINQSSYSELMRTLSKSYSGFVHGAAPHIMDMYGGNPPHFYTKGMLGTPRMKEHEGDLWNYVYRTFVAHILVAKAFGARSHVDILTEHLNQIEINVGMR